MGPVPLQGDRAIGVVEGNRSVQGELGGPLACVEDQVILTILNHTTLWVDADRKGVVARIAMLLVKNKLTQLVDGTFAILAQEPCVRDSIACLVQSG